MNGINAATKRENINAGAYVNSSSSASPRPTKRIHGRTVEPCPKNQDKKASIR